MPRYLTTLGRLCYPFLLWLPLHAQLPVCAGSPAAPEVNEGIRALSETHYTEAAEHFQAATQVDPSCANAWLYLGNAYMQQYIPGNDSPENLAMAEKAREQYQKVLDQQPEDQPAMEAIATLYFNQKKLDDAQVWFEKLTVVNADNKVAFYTLGVIAWTRAHRACTEARTKLGMKPEDPGPLTDAAVRQELRTRHLAGLQEGIDQLNRAIEIDGEYDDALNYLNLIYRQKADLENTPQDYQEDIGKAQEWAQKAAEVKKEKAGAAQ